ncbi:hypothetical protein [Nocardia donostiensis]|uniref:hypothetical protein n=1 Tax=Nocardia donostiensis TaxID=1538463 RepID=UPI0011159A1C|nr:hypothetical protein [Nocardia donostiensis]
MSPLESISSETITDNPEATPISAPLITDTTAGAVPETAIAAATGAGTGEYWTVELVRPEGASEGVLAYIALAETVIQTAVDLLGRGMPSPPPNVDELLTSVVHESLGAGEASKAYKKTLYTVEASQAQLQAMDEQVSKTSITVAAEQDQTLRAIKDIVAKLNTLLQAVSGVDLKPAQEVKLMDHIAAAVEAVYAKVTQVSDMNAEMAGEKNGGGGSSNGGGVPTGGATGGGGGGSGGDLMSSLLPMLAMAPMALMPLAQLLPDLLDPEKDKEDDKAGEGEQKNGAPGKPGEQTPPPGDPNAPTDPNAPQNGATAPQGQPGPANPEGNAPTAPAPDTPPPPAPGTHV